jgi:uncharacterized protein (DUF362 family)
MSLAQVALVRAGADPGGPALAQALGRLAERLDWGAAPSPFRRVVPPGARVLVKPNWVLHANRGPDGLAPLVTSPALVQAVAEALLRGGPSRVTIGDAPLQECDLGALLQAGGLSAWAERLAAGDSRFAGLRDFRRTTCVVRDGVRVPREAPGAPSEFVLFDLGRDSLLEPVTSTRAPFRVTQYDPRHLARAHGPGRHCYLVARAAIEADVVVNVPKLKTHLKAGLTGSLKNLVGINGNKEYLPHHRLGGAASGGDCYPGRSPLKRALEWAHDRGNRAGGVAGRRLWRDVIRVLGRAQRLGGDGIGVEGSWSGNDTIWRTCLDLNRILLYGRLDGTLAETVQRRVLHVVDAVVAGQGDGPLAPRPLSLGILAGGGSAAAVDWVGARLLGYDPQAVPLTREAFARFRWPLTAFGPEDVRVTGDLGDGGADAVPAWPPLPVLHPRGWRDASLAAAPLATASAG